MAGIIKVLFRHPAQVYIPDMYQARLKHISKLLEQEEHPSALLLSSAPSSQRTHDLNYVFRQNSNFFYATGITAPNLVLLLRPRQAPLLFATKISKQQVIWEGRSEKFSALAARLGARLIYTPTIKHEALKFVGGVRTLYFDNQAGGLSFEIAKELFARPAHRRAFYPRRFVAAEELLAPLRLIKQRHEVEAIKTSAKLTCEALHAGLAMIKPGVSEREVAAAIEHCFAQHSAEPAFGTIVACGANAVTLHHRASAAKLRAGELVLIDCGAEHELYCGDVSRTLPISGLFDDTQAELYELVLRAQKAALKRVRPGATVRAVHQAASDTLLHGLLSRGIMRGDFKRHAAKGTLRSYFPHSIGHSLGIDVHDVHDLDTALDLKLQPGMVLTLEPGLYFAKKIKRIRPLGIRIEDDVLVTRTGAQILSTGFPREIAEIEALMR